MYGYNPYLQNYQTYNNNMSQSNTQDERIWVQNETSAEAYLLAPNGFARLWDSSKNRFYEKRADANGRPLQMEVYEYTRVTPQNSVINDNSIKVSYEEINAKIEAINERIEALENSKRGGFGNARKSDTDNTGL